LHAINNDGAPDTITANRRCFSNMSADHAVAIARRWTDAVDMRLLRASAREAIVMGDRELGLVQLGIRLAGA
jgi:hypothetical protein